jgi:hypothetical protein
MAAPQPGSVWNSTLRRKKPMARGSLKPKRTAIKQVGKKGRANERSNKAIDAELTRLGIRWCEASLPACTGTYMLQRAHSKKRRNWLPGDETRAILACDSCHKTIELWKEEKMERFVLDKIAARVR